MNCGPGLRLHKSSKTARDAGLQPYRFTRFRGAEDLY